MIWGYPHFRNLQMGWLIAKEMSKTVLPMALNLIGSHCDGVPGFLGHKPSRDAVLRGDNCFICFYVGMGSNLGYQTAVQEWLPVYCM